MDKDSTKNGDSKNTTPGPALEESAVEAPERDIDSNRASRFTWNEGDFTVIAPKTPSYPAGE